MVQRIVTRRAPNVERERSTCALLLIDVVNALEFEGAERLVRRAVRTARNIARVRRRAQLAHIPTVYVNDNFGRWRSDFQSTVRHCTRRSSPGRDLTRLLLPSHEDYFVLKPFNSGFYSTALDSLLQRMGARTLILAGIATDNCVLFTAHDAYLRGYRLVVPSDCSIAEANEYHRQALAIIARVMKADTRPSRRLRIESLLDGADS